MPVARARGVAHSCVAASSGHDQPIEYGECPQLSRSSYFCSRLRRPFPFTRRSTQRWADRTRSRPRRRRPLLGSGAKTPYGHRPMAQPGRLARPRAVRSGWRPCGLGASFCAGGLALTRPQPDGPRASNHAGAGVRKANLPIKHGHFLNTAASQKTRALPNQTLALPDQTRPLPNQTHGTSNHARPPPLSGVSTACCTTTSPHYHNTRPTTRSCASWFEVAPT